MRKDGNEMLPLSQEQAANFWGNCLALAGGDGTPIYLMSSQACATFPRERSGDARSTGHSAHRAVGVEKLGGGSARCLVGELL